MITMNKEDLINLGFGTTISQNIIRRAKRNLVEQGFDMYTSKKVTIVPIDEVQKITGLDLDNYIRDENEKQG